MHAGLVDDLAYEDQIDAKLQPSGGPLTRLKSDDYARVSGSSVGLGSGPRIAVINAVGIINSGRSGIDPLNGAVAGSDTLVEYIRKARNDASIKAIVLRIDSPGGSTIASDVIWRELTLARTGKQPRPLVASMSDLAASGGYYIAMAAPDIVAEPGTLTGSIGIYGGKIVTGGLYEKLGMNIEAVSAGKHAEMNSPVRPFNEAERAKLEGQLKAFYDQFVEKVARARKHDAARRSTPSPRGACGPGSRRRRIGLVDALGGLDRAVALAKERAKIPAVAAGRTGRLSAEAERLGRPERVVHGHRPAGRPAGAPRRPRPARRRRGHRAAPALPAGRAAGAHAVWVPRDGARD